MWRFLVFSFTGSFIWCALLAWGGYVFGSNWEALRAAMRPFDIPIAIAILAGVGYYIYRHVQKGKKRQQVANSKWQMANSKWQMANSK